MLVGYRDVIDHAHLPASLLGQNRGDHVSVTEAEGSGTKRQKIVLVGKVQLPLWHVADHDLGRSSALPGFVSETIGGIAHEPEPPAEFLGGPESHLDPGALHVIETVHR